MPSECSSCQKSLPGPAAAASFCMHCGAKLVLTDVPTRSYQGMVGGYSEGPRSSDIDPDITADVDTKAYAQTPDDFDDDTAKREPAPEVLAGYRIMALLGSGGQGDVYEAEELSTGQRVAVKLLSAKYTSSSTSVERFRQEGRLASQISHPRCVFVFGADTDKGRPFIVMELMPGQTLKDMVERKGSLPTTEAIARILDVIDGLAEAHRLGVIHRDVKPSNCFLTADDRVKVGDFGLSKSLGGSNPAKHLTGSGRFVGTVLFAPPEQIRGEEVGYDSDVYAVCATLYFLLTGQAPHQHESVTAALAKVISEPPPPIRPKRPDVPRDLERIVLRGLDRDRARRWQSLTDLRDALAALLPSRQIPARPRALIVAYLLDCILIYILAIPLEIVREYFIPTSTEDVLFGISWITLSITLLYFTLCEGLLGTTFGKWLVRLKVVLMGQAGPPGILRAFIRTMVFNLLWYMVFFLPGLLVPLFGRMGAAGQFFGIVLSAGLVITGLVLFINQCRRKWAYRGVQDFASNCRVTTTPRPPRRATLISTFNNPLEQFQVSPKPLPESVGGFLVRGYLAPLGTEGMIWAAEDRGLGRKVLLKLLPASNPVRTEAPIRPTRCRLLGNGELTWANKKYVWEASVAPAGAPLADLLSPTRPVSWADTRPVLEQLTEELIASEKDNTTPERLGVDQVWVEPGGRVQLTDFPLPTGTPGTTADEFNGIGLIRQTAVLMLEGKPWGLADKVAAPIPPHASRIVNKLVSPADPYLSLKDLQHDLAESHIHPARIGSTQRATHLGVQGLFMALGLLICLMMTTLLSFFITLASEQTMVSFRHLADEASQAEVREKLLANPEFVKSLGKNTYDETLDRFEVVIQHLEKNHDNEKPALTRWEKYAIDGLVTTNRVKTKAKETAQIESVMASIAKFENDEQAMREFNETNVKRVMVNTSLITLGMCYLGWIVFAVIFRGGVSWFLGAITIVRHDGRPANRWLVAIRCFLVWLPVFLLFFALVGVQVYMPLQLGLRVALSITVPVLLLVYIVLGIRFPERPPQDRLLRTYLVPV